MVSSARPRGCPAGGVLGRGELGREGRPPRMLSGFACCVESWGLLVVGPVVPLGKPRLPGPVLAVSRH